MLDHLKFEQWQRIKHRVPPDLTERSQAGNEKEWVSRVVQILPYFHYLTKNHCGLAWGNLDSFPDTLIRQQFIANKNKLDALWRVPSFFEEVKCTT